MNKNKICPICNKPIIGHPALSRTDNKTEICTKCGIMQAGQALLNHINTMLALDDIEKVFSQYKDPITSYGSLLFSNKI